MNSNHPWELVTDPSYFRGVMKTMDTAGLGSKEDVWVRFGKLGTGENKRPHYQVHGSDGRIIRFRGANHSVYHENPYKSFEPEHISEEIFTYPDIVKLLAHCLTKA